MQFRLLGPLEVLRGGRSLPLGGAKQKALLALLLLHHDTVVSADRLIEEIWGDEPPFTAPGVLQSYVSRLRKVLEEGAPVGSVLSGRRPGYVLALDDAELDLDTFDALRDRGSAALAALMASEASTAFREALALFRGPPLERQGDAGILAR